MGMLINCSNAMQCKGSLQTKKCVTPGGCLSEREFVNNKYGNIVVDFNLLFTSYKYRLFTLASGFWPLWPRRQAVLCLDQPLGLQHFFLAPTGALGVTIFVRPSVRLFGSNLSRALNLHLSVSQSVI